LQSPSQRLGGKTKRKIRKERKTNRKIQLEGIDNNTQKTKREIQTSIQGKKK